LVSILGSRRVGQTVIVVLHSVTGNPEVLTGITIVVMQPIHKVSHII
jgi:hypothetical protein